MIASRVLAVIERVDYCSKYYSDFTTIELLLNDYIVRKVGCFMNERIVVVVPVYNLESFLSRCIDSLLAQTYEDYEIILIDDGSNDGSEILCDQYVQKYPEKIQCIHKPNGGLSSARNAGIDVANGKYIIFPDPDDWVDRNYLQQLMDLQMQYSPDLVCIGYNIEFDNTCIPTNLGQKRCIMSKQEAQKALFFPPYISGFAWNKLYQLDIIRMHKLRFLDDVGITEDLDFAFRYLQYCEKVVFSPEERLYHYYQRQGAATNSSFSYKKIESIKTYKKIIAVAEDKEIIQASEEEICNTAINLVYDYQESHLKNEKIWNEIHQYLGQYLKSYCISQRYGFGRKVQAIMAYYMPKFYVFFKKQSNKKV